jgi:amino acid adenylation domain-containing protein
MRNLDSWLTKPPLAEQRRTLRERLLRDRGLQRQALPEAPRGGDLVLSSAQRRLWFLDKLTPGQSTYNIPLAVRLTGTLREAALLRSLDEIIRRHEALRTTFIEHEGEPRQRINPPEPLALERLDLSAEPAATRLERARAAAARRAQEPFDLAQGPLLRAVLIRLDAEEYLLGLTLHHIVGDGWSLGVLVRELGALYPAFARESASPLPELARQYADFAHFQQEALQSEDAERDLAFWKQALAGNLPVLELPSDHRRALATRAHGARIALPLPAPLIRALNELAQQRQCTRFMVLLAAFNALLARYSGQTDVLVGTPVANRSRVETEALVGFFVNTLVLRVDASGDPSFYELLERVREVAVAAYAHQDLPFEKLVEELAPARDTRQTPLFQVMFDYVNTPLGALDLPDLRVEVEELDNPTAKFDLTWIVEERGEALASSVEYRTDRFDPATMERLVAHLALVLARAAEHPESPISELTRAPADHAAQETEQFNQTGRPYPEACLHRLFTERASSKREQTALIEAGRRTSYGELEARSAELARRLARLGVHGEVRVGLLLDRSTETVIAILGVLKAGGCYVPLDPSLPALRLDFLVSDSACPVVIASRAHLAIAERIGATAAEPIRILCLEEMLRGDDGASSAASAPPLPAMCESAEQAAYVMYTSGSTGTPKGIVVSHRAVVRLVCNGGFVELQEEARMLLSAPLGFDASTFELWGALLNGAELTIAPPGAQSLEATGALIRSAGISTLWMTTALFRQMTEHGLADLRGVRQLLTGGEVMPLDAVRRLLEHVPECRLIHCYGPTENTTFSTTQVITALAEDTDNVPIGGPIGNSTAYVLDSEGRPQLLGVVGELYVGGAGLSRGYLNRAELTAES